LTESTLASCNCNWYLQFEFCRFKTSTWLFSSLYIHQCKWGFEGDEFNILKSRCSYPAATQDSPGQTARLNILEE
jgi:hypothetical protein